MKNLRISQAFSCPSITNVTTFRHTLVEISLAVTLKRCWDRVPVPALMNNITTLTLREYVILVSFFHS